MNKKNVKSYIEEFRIDNYKLIYEIEKKNVKRITLKINSEGNVKIVIPMRVSKESAEKIIEDKKEWILDKLQKINEKKDIIKEKELKSGEELFFMGKKYILKITESDKKECVNIKNDEEIEIYIKNENSGDENKIKKIIMEWYMEELKILLKEKVEKYSKLINKYPKSVTIKKLKSSWGICSFYGDISINWRIIMAPEEVIDYLIVHELCHLVHHNHSKKYWELVESIIENHKEKRKWLKENGLILKI